MTIYSSLDRLEALKTPELQEIFLEVMQNIVDRALLDEMIAAIEANDPERLFRATGFTQASLEPLIDAIEQIYKDAAQTTVSGWPKIISTPTGPTIFRFDMRNPRVENDLRTNSSALITRLTEEARMNVKKALEQGAINGWNPRKTALDIVGRIDPVTRKRTGGIVGLTEHQEGWVRNANRYLEQLDKRYFTLTLRDKRFDSIVQKAIDSGKSLSADDVDRIVTSYKNKALKYRADAIARTETVQSLNRGEWMAYAQAIEEGTISNDMVTKEWDDAGDGRVRPTHRYLANKYGKEKGIGLNEPFVSISGDSLMFPGDSSLGAGANEITHCRCKMRIHVNFRKRGE